MARFVIEDRLGQYGTVADFIGGVALTIVAATPTLVKLVDAEGDGFTFLGSDLTYSGQGLTGGTFTELNVFNSAGQTLVSVDRFSFSAVALITTFNTLGLAAAVAQMTSGNDLWIGSSVGDILSGGDGRDILRGGAGADYLFGDKGGDVLTGGAGQDTFVFSNGATDRITDFHDADLNSDDFISLTGRMYRSMTVTETLTGVELDFGLRGSLIVDGWHAIDVSRSDFIFA